ncbi:right-handed parallel beta-helix repeat-containing protein [Thalassotalea euphylliae]|nr:right-handed parallel beta-helix repeat-containing protein [Thalassotalea euphylliae]
MKRVIFILFMSAFAAHSESFSEYCQYNNGEQDCSVEFVRALQDIAGTGRPLLFEANNTYRLDSVDTSQMNLSGIKLQGIANQASKPVILTDRLYLTNISDLAINNLQISGIHNDIGDVQQDSALVLLGAKKDSPEALNITVQNMHFENAADTLLIVWNTKNLNISNNVFKRAGLAMRIDETPSDPDDERPRGNAAVFSGITGATITFNEIYEIKKTGLFFGGVNRNVYILNNYIDLLNYEKPTKRYGLKGGAGIYIGNSPTFYNMLIQGNRIINYRMNAVRMNGDGVIVKKNYFNVLGDCADTSIDSGVGDADTGIAVKAHYLTNSEISENCFQNTYTGVALESWDTIKNVKISKNLMNGISSGVFVTYKYGGSYSDISIVRNTFYDALEWGIAFFSESPSFGNSIVSNTFVNNDGAQQKPLISLRRQSGFYFDNNWIMAKARSQNWNFVTLREVSNSVFQNSVFKSYDGTDRSFGGFTIYDKKSTNNFFKNISFDGLYPGYIDNGTENKFIDITYQ